MHTYTHSFYLKWAQVCKEWCHLYLNRFATNDRLLPIGGNLSLSLNVFKLICRTLMHAKWDFLQLYARERRWRTAEEKDRKGEERLRGMKGRRQGCWLVKRFACSTCYAFCPFPKRTKPLWRFNTHHKGVHIPECLVSLCLPPVTFYVISSSILHKG